MSLVCLLPQSRGPLPNNKGSLMDTGVLSEFTVMDGIKEAVTEIILNIKEIVVKAESSGERRMSLSVKGLSFCR